MKQWQQSDSKDRQTRHGFVVGPALERSRGQCFDNDDRALHLRWSIALALTVTSAVPQDTFNQSYQKAGVFAALSSARLQRLTLAR